MCVFVIVYRKIFLRLHVIALNNILNTTCGVVRKIFRDEDGIVYIEKLK